MPETRYRELYKDGKLISKEPYEVSDEELKYDAAIDKIRELGLKSDLAPLEIKQAILALLKYFRRLV